MKYAEVVVRTPLRRHAVWGDMQVDEDSADLLRTFHYSVPTPMRDELTVGQLVWVPFGPRRLQGIVLSLSDTSPVAQTRDIEAILSPVPLLTQTQIALARWISEYYLAPLYQTVWLMIPPGLGQTTEMVLELNTDAALPPRLTTNQRRVIEVLKESGSLTLRQLSRRIKVENLRHVVDQLARRGIVHKRHEIRAPRTKRKTERILRLVRPIDNEMRALTQRSPKQREVLEYLIAQPDHGLGWHSVSEIRTSLQVNAAIISALARKGLIELEERLIWRDPLAGREFVLTTPPQLTPGQEEVWREIQRGLNAEGTRVYLLHGVTGSGKTEIYLRALQEVLSQGKTAIALVPEISLTPQTIRRFAARFPDRLAVLHSKLSAGERYDQWERVRRGLASVVIGPRSALFAPVRNLGLIVLDEEHEWSYKQDSSPRYHARDVAIKLGELSGAAVILGSATPDIESYYRAQRGEYTLLRLPQRIMGHRRHVEEQRAQLALAQTDRPIHLRPGGEEVYYMELPPVQIVDMREELKAGNRSIFSRALQRALRETLAEGEQAILFLNRRGSATFVMCRDCGYVIKCSRCDVPMTYHSHSEQLICHHCNRRMPIPSTCPNCASKRIRYFGIGTQRVEQAVREMFPDARVLRWDRDVTGAKGAHEELLQRFIDREADIMVGTQMIAKGLDLPFVTLVGVITADTALNLPDLRAAERTFQLLTQVAGRAGRSILGGRVIVQTYTPGHYAIQAASRHDYDAFYQHEIAFRRTHWYPPFSHLIRLICVQSNARRCREESQRMHRILTNKIERLGLPDIDLIGPSPCFISRVRGKYRWQIIVRGNDPHILLRDIPLPLGWRIDVDPVSTL